MQERAQRTRETIVRAAAAAFEVNGYGATRLQDIIGEESVSKGALYFHFPTKEALAIAIVGEYAALWGQLIERLRPHHPRALVLLIELSREVGAAFKNNVVTRAGTRLLLETRLYESQMPPPYAQWTAGIEELLGEAARQGDLVPEVDIPNVARFIVASFTGLQQVSMAGGGPTTPDACITSMWRCMLPGLVPAGSLPEFIQILQGGEGSSSRSTADVR